MEHTTTENMKVFVHENDVVIRCEKRSDAMLLAPFVGAWLKNGVKPEINVETENAR